MIRFDPPSSSEWGAILTSDGLGDAVEQMAEMGRDHAASIAPVASGEYRDSFRVERTVENGRAVAHLVNDAEHAADVEWGQERHVLSKTADFLEGGA